MKKMGHSTLAGKRAALGRLCDGVELGDTEEKPGGGSTSHPPSLRLGGQLSLQTLEQAAIGWKGGELAGVASGLQLWAKQATSTVQRALPGSSAWASTWASRVWDQNEAQKVSSYSFVKRTNSSAFVQQEGGSWFGITPKGRETADSLLCLGKQP